jgi:hypothetical protein
MLGTDQNRRTSKRQRYAVICVLLLLLSCLKGSAVPVQIQTYSESDIGLNGPAGFSLMIFGGPAVGGVNTSNCQLGGSGAYSPTVTGYFYPGVSYGFIFFSGGAFCEAGGTFTSESPCYSTLGGFYETFSPQPPTPSLNGILLVLPNAVLFSWPGQTNGNVTLPADGGQYSPSPSNQLASVTDFSWSIIGNDYGCSINATNGTVTTSTNEGSITVEADDLFGDECYEQNLDLKLPCPQTPDVACSACSGGDGGLTF